MMKTHFKYFCYFVRHKWFVLLECLKYRLIWRGIIHDWTKLLPQEWIAYANRYHGTHHQATFDRAVNHHHKHNDHHWQYWVYLTDSGEQIVLAMTDAARKELVADWRGANRAIGLKESALVDWYLENYDIFLFHPDTRTWLDTELSVGRSTAQS